MYITVKYGEKEQAIFNPNCRNILLLNNIRDTCQCEKGVEVELSDESGNVKHLRQFPQRYANECLGDRETLVLLQVHRPDSGDDSFVPLLHDDVAINETFLSQLASKSNLGIPHGRRSRSRPNSSRRPPAKSAGSKSNVSDTSKESSKEKTKSKPSRTSSKRQHKGR